ncbi:MAG: hypothetical protein KC457_33815, partial [Myxococcales bacterium]|nr:hypothetical protein [Myxococcales bacterium]
MLRRQLPLLLTLTAAPLACAGSSTFAVGESRHSFANVQEASLGAVGRFHGQLFDPKISPEIDPEVDIMSVDFVAFDPKRSATAAEVCGVEATSDLEFMRVSLGDTWAKQIAANWAGELSDMGGSFVTILEVSYLIPRNDPRVASLRERGVVEEPLPEGLCLVGY